MHYEKFQDGTVKCIEDEIPFEIPEGWAWCHYSDVIELYSEQGLTPDRYNDTGEGIPYITGARNLEHGKVIINRWTITPTTHASDELKKDKHHQRKISFTALVFLYYIIVIKTPT